MLVSFVRSCLFAAFDDLGSEARQYFVAQSEYSRLCRILFRILLMQMMKPVENGPSSWRISKLRNIS